jgi:hypothetical protein
MEVDHSSRFFLEFLLEEAYGMYLLRVHLL